MNALLAAWDRLWFAPASLRRLALFRIALALLVLQDVIGTARVVLRDAAALDAGDPHLWWSPILLFQVLGWPPLGLAAAELLYGAMLVLPVLVALGIGTRFTCFALALGFLYWTGLIYGFGKPHHDKVALAFALLGLWAGPAGGAYSIDAWLRRRRRGAEPVESDLAPWAALPLRFAQISAVFGYAFAGWSKLAISGLAWANGYSLQGIMLGHDNVWAELLTSRVELSAMLSAGALALQSSFPLILFFPRLRWLYLPGAVAFHVGTWHTMDTGPYITLWFTLLAFLPLEQVPGWFHAELRSRAPWRVARALLVTLAPLALSTYVFSVHSPVVAAVLFLASAAYLLSANRTYGARAISSG
jgi:hypothetical protein